MRVEMYDTADRRDFASLSNLSNLDFSNCSKNVQNVIQLTLNWLFFLKKLQELPSGWGLAPIVVTCSLTHTIFTTNNFQNHFYTVLNKQML